MAKILLDLMGEAYREVEVNCFTIPGSGVCITVKTDRTEVELDLPDTVFERLVRSVPGIK